ncbi:MAG: ABC transporter permease [Fimbriimonas ginsengisoli]|uniref:ABC transporter permease n=1 Tax=Fimbriimonas ginsengisoli TaxID=1005039 RepID=A0A931PTW4_FIMGI|nr:ABC transporter permease [Fimbriimonas ginsengisoli]
MVARPRALPVIVEAPLVFVGEVAMLLADTTRRLLRRPIEIVETVEQMAFIGVASVPIVALTGFFSGAVLSLYLSEFLGRYGATGFVGATVGLTVTRELGPVVAGIMVAARCGSAMAAQIGTMKVTEQIDALKMLSVHPTNYLVIPRAVAAVLMLPVLALVCMYSGVFGGWLVAMTRGVPSGVFIQSVRQYVEPSDFLNGIAKTPWFGLIIAVVACQQGLRTTNGAVGVGRATTNSVVISMVLVYVANYFLAQLMY